METVTLDLMIKALFDVPTVAQMALIVEQNSAKRANESALEQMLREVEMLTEDEAQRRVDEIKRIR